MSRSLLAEISVDELMHLREEGLSNREIAERLNTTQTTIRKYIGPQPKDCRAVYGAAVKPPKASSTDVIQPKNTLVLELRVSNFAGEMAHYKVTSMGKVDVVGAQEHFTKDELQTYIVELMEIYSQL